MGRAIALTIFQRILFAFACIFLGFLFFPLFFVGGLIAWSVYRDIVEAPARRAEQLEIEARINAPVSAKDIRWACESPAETAFLDIMVAAYALHIVLDSLGLGFGEDRKAVCNQVNRVLGVSVNIVF